MKFTARPFELNDLSRLYQFLGEVRYDIEHSHYLHVGDLTWQLFHMLASHQPSDLIRLWHDEQGNLGGFVLVYPDFGTFDLQLHPDFRNIELESEMFTWAQTRITTLNKPAAFYTLVNQNDNSRKIMLEAHGYQPMGDWLYMQRSLDTSLSEPQLPPSFRLGDMTAVDFTSRVQALAAAFGAQPRPQLYQQFVNAQGYAPELDVVTVNSAGQVASFAMCWVDDVSKVGEFEPVGTLPDFQHKGLGKAVLLEGMRRMSERGMQHVIVIVDASEEPACHLYHSVGLAPRWNIHLYGKHLNNS